MEENTFIPESQPEYKRPQLLSVLCILTFVWTGLTIFTLLMILLFPDLMISSVKASPDIDEQTKEYLIPALQAGAFYYLTMLIFNLLSFTGAILMWKLRKEGFHFYTIANILLFSIPVIWLGQPFTFAGAFFQAVFIGFYAMYLRFMK